MKIIKTKEFILRHVTLKDLKGYYETETDPTSKKMFMSFPANINEAKKDLEETIKKNNVKPPISETFSIIMNGEYAGYVKLQFQNFDPKTDEGRVHLAIHPDFRGKGLATKALWEVINYGFKKRGFKRIFAQCKAVNEGVIKVNKKVGFKIKKNHVVEGVKKILWVLEKKDFKRLK